MVACAALVVRSPGGRKLVNARTRRWFSGCCLLAIGLPTHAGTLLDQIGVVAQVGNDWTYHGTSEVLGEDVIGVNVELSLYSQWFFGLETHRARLPRNEERQRQQGLQIYVGREFTLSKQWHSSVSLTHRVFINSGAEWDFTELSADITHDSGLSLRIDYSPDYYARDSQAFAVEAQFNRNLTDRSYWYLLVGALELSDDDFLDHRYASAGVGASLASANLDIGYQWNSRRSDELFGVEPFSPSQWVVRLSYRLW